MGVRLSVLLVPEACCRDLGLFLHVMRDKRGRVSTIGSFGHTPTVTRNEAGRSAVRFLAKVTIPKDVEDEASKSGALQRAVQSVIDRLKPEAAYFFEQDGGRECVFIINLDVGASLKAMFSDLQPSIYVTPVVNTAEFQQGLEGEGKQLVAQKSDLLADLKPGASPPLESQPATAGDSAGPVPLRTRADQLASKKVVPPDERG
jgi:hypothetical protein